MANDDAPPYAVSVSHKTKSGEVISRIWALTEEEAVELIDVITKGTLQEPLEVILPQEVNEYVRDHPNVIAT